MALNQLRALQGELSHYQITWSIAVLGSILHALQHATWQIFAADLSLSTASQSLLRRWGCEADELSQIEEHLHVLSTAHQPDDDSW